MSLVRYSGGKFVSGSTLGNGVGPVEEHLRRLDLASTCTERNEIGATEFVTWAKPAGVEVNLAVDLGTRSVDAIPNLVEFCDHPDGTYWSDLRRVHGVETPHGFRTWGLGYEMDEPCQMGHTTAEAYGRVAARTAVAKKWVARRSSRRHAVAPTPAFQLSRSER